MIKITQEMRDAGYREAGIIPYLEDPVGRCRAKERKLVSNFIEPLRELIHSLDLAEETGNEIELFDIVDNICHELVNLRSVEQGDSILARYHRENYKDSRIPILLAMSAGKGDSARTERSKKPKQ
jgi:hypothetical protein